MPFKDLLVVVDHGQSCPARIDLAARLAGAFDAHLTGLYVNPPFFQPVVLAEFPLELRDVEAQAVREAAERARPSTAESTVQPPCSMA